MSYGRPAVGQRRAPAGAVSEALAAGPRPTGDRRRACVHMCRQTRACVACDFYSPSPPPPPRRPGQTHLAPLDNKTYRRRSSDHACVWPRATLFLGAAAPRRCWRARPCRHDHRYRGRYRPCRISARPISTLPPAGRGPALPARRAGVAGPLCCCVSMEPKIIETGVWEINSAIRAVRGRADAPAAPRPPCLVSEPFCAAALRLPRHRPEKAATGGRGQDALPGRRPARPPGRGPRPVTYCYRVSGSGTLRLRQETGPALMDAVTKEVYIDKSLRRYSSRGAADTAQEELPIQHKRSCGYSTRGAADTAQEELPIQHKRSCRYSSTDIDTEHKRRHMRGFSAGAAEGSRPLDRTVDAGPGRPCRRRPAGRSMRLHAHRPSGRACRRRPLLPGFARELRPWARARVPADTPGPDSACALNSPPPPPAPGQGGGKRRGPCVDWPTALFAPPPGPAGGGVAARSGGGRVPACGAGALRRPRRARALRVRRARSALRP